MIKIILPIAAIILLIAALYVFVFVRPRARSCTAALRVDYAHRGLHGGTIPENSLAAFERAVSHGYGIELDVQLSRDGEVMVFHDYTLVRMTGREGFLSELTAAELSELRLASTNEHIPTLREVLALVDGRVPLLVELKGESGNTALCEPLAKLLSAYDGPFCIESFNPLLLYRMSKLMPDIYRGLLYTNLRREKKKATLVNILLDMMLTNIFARPDFIAFDEKYRTSLPVRICTGLFSAGRFCWTVRSRENYTVAKRHNEFVIFENFLPQ